MTMPSLISKYKEKSTVTYLKKMNSILQQAFIQIHNEEGLEELSKETFNSSDIELMNRFGKYLQYQKICPENKGGCWKGIMYKSIKGEDYSTFDDTDSGITRSSAILADGAFIMFNIRNNAPVNFAQIYIDINGHKPPNKLGVDFFYWFIMPDRIFPGGVPSCGKYGTCKLDDFIRGCTNDNGYSCTAWAIYNENMDYLHCPDKLGWDKAHSCK